jgi:hypothetical protein
MSQLGSFQPVEQIAYERKRGSGGGGGDRRSQWRILFQFLGLLDSAGLLEEQGFQWSSPQTVNPVVLETE